MSPGGQHLRQKVCQNITFGQHKHKLGPKPKKVSGTETWEDYSLTNPRYLNLETAPTLALLGAVLLLAAPAFSCYVLELPRTTCDSGIVAKWGGTGVSDCTAISPLWGEYKAALFDVVVTAFYKCWVAADVPW